jgi:hypothetical protein
MGFKSQIFTKIKTPQAPPPTKTKRRQTGRKMNKFFRDVALPLAPCFVVDIVFEVL